MFSLPDLAAAWRGGALKTSTFLRELLRYERWRAPDSGGPNSTASIPEGGSAAELCLFSDGPAADRAGCGETHVKEHSGLWIFSQPLGLVESVRLDSRSAHEVFLERDSITALRKLASAMAIEDALVRLSTGNRPAPGSVRQVRDYHSYILAVDRSQGEPHPVTTRARGDLSLVAVFTSEDSFEAFREECRGSRPGIDPEPLPLSGERLFAYLTQMGTEGMIFNCAGPAEPAPFGPQFAHIVCSL
jgi:hypothetical protein